MSREIDPTRRDVVIAGAALTLAASSAAAQQNPATPGSQAPSPSQPGSPEGATTIRGTVREDLSRTGGRGITDLPIPGVLVSNGRDVVRTDAAGRYSLPIEPGMTIFVVKPSGYAVPTDLVTHIPIFSHVHEPEGTPADLDFRYFGLAPTGPLPEAIDFALIRVNEPSKFDVVLLTDPQPESTAEIEYVRDDVVAGLIGVDAAFGITAGDLMFDDLTMYNRYNKIIGRIGIPWWSVGGNHDLNYEAPNSRHARDTWKRVFGAPHYAHEYGNALFIMLDNVDYLGPNTQNPGKPGKYRGFVSQDQLTFVANLLKETPRERLIVLVMHIPLATYLGPEPNQNTVNASELLKLLDGRPSVSFSGHTHSTEHHYFGASDGYSGAVPHHHHVMTAVSGSWWSGPLDHRGIACADAYDGSPNGFHILSIDGANYTTRYVPAAEPAGKQMRISLETQTHQDDREVLRTLTMSELLRSPITSDQAAGASILVNVFDGGPKTVVTCSIDAGPAVTMKKVNRPDPFVQQIYARHPETIKPWVKPMPSSHLWTVKLPAGLRPGAYAVKVKAIDEYGREHRDSMVLEIA